MKQYRILRFTGLFLLLAAFGALTACDDWTRTESVDNTVKKPWEQDPALWAEYTAALRAYKQSEHFIAYARLRNSPEVASSEQDFMRCLPDSLDVVTLTNADNFSAYDAEDLRVMHEKGTRVLYQVDYAGRAAEFAQAGKLEAYLDRVVAAVAANGMDGYAFTGIPRMGDAATAADAALLLAKLSADDTKLLVFEGDPLFLTDADRAKIDYFVLETEDTEHALDLQMKVLNALDFASVPAEKLLLAARIGAAFHDEDKMEYPAVEEMSRRVISLGPLGGLAAYDIAGDYYHADMNYKTIRQAIQTLNPSK